MSQQERMRKRKERSRTAKPEEVSVRAAGNSHEDVEQKLNEVDAAIDNYLASTTTAAAGPSVVVGQQQQHQVVRPLSNEEFVHRFRQTGGE